MSTAEPTPPAVPHADTDWPFKIPLRARDGTVRAWTLVDELDFEKLTFWHWHVHGRYVARNVPVGVRRQRPMLMHRQILGLALDDPSHTDHRNRDKLDNRRGNLRAVTKAQNQQNVDANRGARSRYRGVSLVRGKWQAEVQVRGVRHYLGYFTDEDEAGEVAAEFRREHMPYAIER